MQEKIGRSLDAVRGTAGKKNSMMGVTVANSHMTEMYIVPM